ncbi:MAG TPA: adenylate/guanylate cyclase domain-containing protein [Solirubrobacterales bacterium]|jgi:adenylate cyclase|nr:adenylate/guanylate cyclase domain-containing protein [Solirubrobacterales bacterium]
MIRGGSLRRRRGRAMLVVALVAAAVGIVFYATGLMRALEAQSVDARFSVRGTQSTPDEIVVVGVDDTTFDELPNTRWPFPRSLEGKVIETLTGDGAKAIAVDIQFTEQTTPRQDNALIEAVRGAPGIVLSTTEENKRGESRIFGGEEVVHELGARAGDTIVPVESGGTTRKMFYEHGGLVSFAVVTAEAMTGARVSPDSFEDNKAWIDYRGPPETFRNVSFSRVLHGKVPASVFRGKTVVIGATSPSLQDLHATSTTGDSLMSGPELQANAIWTAAHGLPLSSSATLVAVLLILLLAAAPAAATLWLKPPPALAVAVGLGLAYALAAQLAFDGGTVLPLVYPLLALIVSALGALALNYVVTSFERQRVHDTFARFVPEAVVADVLARVDEEDLRFGGVRRECTVLFSDLRGFTSFAEELEPERVIEVLNHYLEEMSDAIMDQGGTLVAYMGDGIMAVFGAPIEQDDHADRALAAAREMLRVRLPRFNEWLVGEGLGEGFAMGIGINSGTVMSGQVGSEKRIEYTAIGDTTNTAARLEGMTKGSGHQVFVADSTKVASRGAEIELEIVGEREVRGRTHTIRIWTLR